MIDPVGIVIVDAATPSPMPAPLDPRDFARSIIGVGTVDRHYLIRQWVDARHGQAVAQAVADGYEDLADNPYFRATGLQMDLTAVIGQLSLLIEHPSLLDGPHEPSEF